MTGKLRKSGVLTRIGICILHALWMLLITWYWLNLPVIYFDEEHLIRWSSATRKILFNNNERPPKEDFIFINLAHEKELIPYSEGMGEEVITNRERLAKFFHILNQYPDQYKFVICDVFFKGSSPFDSLLSAEIAKTKNVLAPCHIEEGILLRPEIPVPNALSDYEDVNGMFLKYRFMEDTLKSLPVVMYEKLHGARVERKHGLTYVNDRLSLSSMIIDFSIRTSDLDTSGYKVVPLSELLLLQDDSLIFHEFLKGKYIVAGNFEEDVHQTILGDMPGTVILLNIYLALVKKKNLVSWYWVLFLFLNYIFISWVMFYSFSMQKPRWFTRFIEGTFGQFLGDSLSFFVYLGLISLISYFIFNIHINILIIGLYVNLVPLLIRKIKQAPDLIRSFKDRRRKGTSLVAGNKTKTL
ncbi:MAG: CHASE2 domain-containing protein [Cytophagaceae bacterium]